ncbi:autotransporter-associated N-terminal domain-containing protein [Fusobacterium animalis]|uniref:autotransporter-associated N-terminal domain-containing protein n=1 Tax=Fusobacterium animalis TaxID=76859 RepID=UPI001C6E37E6|nr:autotransporter-associated N-terminal domain-containing protein [Fusobacterium animalis]QYR63774.1 autotransporter-associated N-terminal domain-containing protein [Fusobacterium animalis]
MNNNLSKIEKDLRSIAKRCKTVKYSIGLAILFLMMGGGAFSQEINNADNISSTTPTMEEINSAKNSLRNSVGDLQAKIKTAREENNKKITGGRLELIQLMEQGDQVVKSPWSSWQFGANYFYSNWRGTYQGKGDKKEKYPYEGLFTRSEDLFLRNIHPDSKHYAEYTSSNSAVTHSLSTLSVGGGSPLVTFGEITNKKGKDPHSATSSLRGGDEDSYGLANTRIRQEDIVKVELGAGVKPKDINKNPNPPIVLNPVKPQFPVPQEPENPAAPVINITGGGILPPADPKYLGAGFINASSSSMKVISYQGRVDEEKTYWTGGSYGKGANGAKNDGQSYNHNDNITLNNSNFEGKKPAMLYTTNINWWFNGSKAVAKQALFKTYFDYGSIGNNTGGKTLTIANGTNITIDSINDAPKKSDETDDINKQDFLVGGSRVGTLHNTPRATIENGGTINLVGPFTIGFEAETDTGNGTRTGQGERKIINSGVITDKAEEGYRDSGGLGGLTVGTIKEDGTEITSSNNKILTTPLPIIGDNIFETTIKRTPDMLMNDGTIKKGGYTGYKVGMILTEKDTDNEGGNSKYSLINKGTIEFNGNDSVGINVYAPNLKHEILEDEIAYNATIDILNAKGATITVNGSRSYGMRLSSYINKIERFENKGTINVGNDKRKTGGSVGIGVQKNNIFNNPIPAPAEDFDKTKFGSGYIGKVKNSGIINVYGTANTAMKLYIDAPGSIAADKKLKYNANVITNAGIINLYGTRNLGMYASDGGDADVMLPPDYKPTYFFTMSRVTNKGTINVNGTGNVAMSAGSAIVLNQAINLEDGTINLKGKNNIAMWTFFVISEGDNFFRNYQNKYNLGPGNIINNGTIKAEGKDNENLTAMVISGDTDGANTGTIDLTGKGVVGVYNVSEIIAYDKNTGEPVVNDRSIFKMISGKNPNKNPKINVVGEKSIAVYSKGMINTTYLERGDISASDGAVALYADRTAIELGKKGATTVDITNSPNLSVSGSEKAPGIMFYNYTYRDYIKGTLSAKEAVLEHPIAKGSFILNNDVNATIGNGGVAFYLIGKDGAKKTEILNDMFPDSKYGKTSAAGKKLHLKMTDKKSTLFVTYNKNIADVDYQKLSTYSNLGTLLGNRVVVDNANSVNNYRIEKTLRNKLEVDTSVNLDDATTPYNRLEYLSSWVKVNSGVNMTSNSANKVAIFQANTKREAGSKLSAPKVEDIQVENNGNITLTGKNSAGLATSFGTVINTSNISSTGENGVGIYAADSSIVKNTGTIQVGTNGVGIFGENDLKIGGNSTAISSNKDINIINSGTIKAKANSTGVYGIYAKNDKTNYTKATSTINNSGNIDLSNNKSSVGIYTENSALTSSGNVSVGKNGVGIRTIKSDVTLTKGDINATSATGVLVEDSTLKTGANISVKDNAIAVSAKNSDVEVQKGTYNINNKSIAFKIADLGSKTFKGNAGTLNLGDNSIAYHIKNSNLTSANFIDNLTVNPTGKYTYLYAEDSTVNYENQKTINSDGSIFIYGKNSDITLEGKADISSNNKKVTGIFSENTIAGKKIINKGKINLLGTGSLGIYAEGNVNIINNGKITVGNTTDPNNAGVGIYSPNGNIENYGEVVAGNKSAGIYGSNINLKANSKVSAGDEGTAVYAAGNNINILSGVQVTAGKKATGIYGKSVSLNANSKLNVGEGSTAVYSRGGTVEFKNGAQITTGNNDSTVLYYDGNNGNIINNTDKLNIGNNSYGFIIKGQNNKFESNSTGNIALKNNSIFIYSKDNTGSVTNKTNITSPGNENYGIYSSGKVDNYGNIDFSSGTGSIGVYSYYPKEDKYTVTEPATSMTPMPIVTNYGTIKVAASDLRDPRDEKYGVGIAVGYTERLGKDANGKAIVKQKAAGHIVNRGVISVTHPNSIGMYATGRDSIAENFGRIELSGSKRNTGMYLENGAVGYNYGTITTVGNNNVGQVGVTVTTGAKIVNAKGATININADDGIGLYSFGGGIIENYGDIKVSETSTPIRKLDDDNDTSKSFGGVEIRVRDDDKTKADIFVNGRKVQPTLVHSIPNRAPSEIPTSSIGIYMGSSGVNPTNPIGNIGALANSGIKSADLIIGTEAAKYSNSKYIQLGKDIIEPYNKMITAALRRGLSKWEIYSSSLTWQATITKNKATQTIENAYMTKVPYTVFAADKNTTRDTYNFTDGLEQRYGVEAIGSREKELFNKLNDIGNNEGILLKQAFDEMMGHQYANIHQRVQSTGNILDKEFNYLKNDWSTASKKSNKIKTFGSRGEYKTNTAGVIDYTNNAYGVVYMHENEGLRLGKGTGWYTGFVYNTFKFKDIGKSKEEMLEAKVGVYKSIPFDYNNSLNWTVSGDISLGYNKMNRKFLVVDEIFNARGRYNTYGVALKNELGKDFRLTENISLRPYGAIKLEYMKIGKVKEKSGEIRLDVKDSHYISVRPEVGVDLNYKYILASGKIITARLGTAYEDELGKVAKANNKAKVAHTSADWFNLPKEKEDRKGNVKTDFSLGVEGEILGGTANIGYDTKGHNMRAGVGFRVIF